MSRYAWNPCTAPVPTLGAPYALVDFETTGLFPSAHNGVGGPGASCPPDRIVEVAVVHGVLGEGKPVVAYESLVRPDRLDAVEASTQWHGITVEDVESAPAWSRISADVFAALEGRVLCAWHWPFEYRWLLANSRRPSQWLPKAGLCAKVLDAMSSTLPPRSLGDAAEARTLPPFARHRAGGDALTAARVLERALVGLLDGGVGTLRNLDSASYEVRQRGLEYELRGVDDRTPGAPRWTNTFPAEAEALRETFAEWDEAIEAIRERRYTC
jgi:DNA polymerase III epsilon subunit-like protein